MKNKKQLTREQRYETEVLLRAGKRQKETAEPVEKDKSVIGRERKRNSHKRGCSARLAQEYADECRERFRRKRSFTDSIRRKIIKELTREQWSPEQIAGRARRDGLPMVSRECICQFIREDKKKGGVLCKHLRHRLKHRKRPVDGKKAVIPDKVSIDLRPDIISQKERFGDREIDTVVGPENKGVILTATERTAGFLLMKKLPKGKNAKALAKELFFLLLPYKQCVLSITSDNGSEFYGHKRIAKYLDANCFFAHPCSSCERGLNEYTNDLIRQYIPKKQDFKNFSDDDIKLFQSKINRRPRKLLNFDAPIE